MFHKSFKSPWTSYDNETRNDGAHVIKSYVPLSEMFGFASILRSSTQGKGSFSMEFEKYSRCPKNIMETLIAEYEEKRKAEQK